MVTIKLARTDGGVEERNAAEILEAINAGASITELSTMNWGNDEGKIDYLQGRKSSLMLNCPIEPLSDEDAKQAVVEYKELMGIK